MLFPHTWDKPVSVRIKAGTHKKWVFLPKVIRGGLTVYHAG